MSRTREAQDIAARWIVAREEPDWSEVDQAKLDVWLAESDFNRVTFLRLEQSWREADRIGSLRPTLMPETLHPARGLCQKMQRWAPLAAAASLIAAVGIGWQGYSLWSNFDLVSARYDTKVGGHKNVDLPDGSKVELNTSSGIRTAVGNGEREVWLERGEVYFEVAHDKTRPFVVHVGNRQVTVLGTKFSVRRDGDKISVFVREGRVRVEDMHGSEAVRSTTIKGGEIALSRGTATLVTAKSSERVEDALAWRDGMLSFDQDPLSEVVAEFNRYNHQQLTVTDPDAASIRIGGIFPASRPVEFVRLLRDAYGLKVEQTQEEIRISD